jgi:hypothetical protein
MKRLSVRLALGLLTGCLPPAERPPIVLSPSPEMRELVERAAPQWTEATGIPLRIAGGGIPVQAAARALDKDGEPSCGTTVVTRRVADAKFIRIEGVTIAKEPPLGCPHWSTGRTLLHELGHIICDWHVDASLEHACHSSGGLMAAVSNETDHVDSESLETVCAFADCARMEAAE